MLSTFFLCLFVGFAASSDYAWKSNTEYLYQVRGRTLASLHEVDNQYAGVVIRAKFAVRQMREGVLVGRLQEPQYAQIHAQLPGGWRSEIPEEHLNFRSMPMTNKPFEIQMKNGTIQELIVDPDVPNWEANLIKSVVSQIQVDVQGENMIKSRYNQPAEHNSNSAEFKTMEDTVTGKCETLYDIDALPEYILQSKPELAPLPYLKADGEFIDVVKTKNFSNCDERVGYHFGLKEMQDWEPVSASMGDFFLKSSVSRVILSGNLKRHTIQSSVTTNKIVLKPTPNSDQKGAVYSLVNITLSSVDSVSGQKQELSERKSLGNLVYRYNSPYASDNKAREGSRNSEEHKYDSGSSSSSSSSSEEHVRGFAQKVYEDNQSAKFRQRRSVGQYDSSSSSSFSSSESDSAELNPQLQQDKPSMSSPPETPLLPYTVGYKGQSIKNAQGINFVQLVQKLAVQIGRELQNPSDIPTEDTLAKFTILCNLLRNMNVKEMQEASRELYNLKNKEQREQTDAWRTYRDAVAQAGTGPALLTIKEWIESSKIKNHEAASIIATVAESARTPTDEYMRTFYALATEPQVQQQAYLNDTAILSFADLVRKVYVDDDASYNQYPVHAFGKFYNQHNEVVHKEYIPYFGKQMKEAIKQGDSHKIQVYIRALGNIGDRQILSYFEPYLEGEKQVSQFQRLLMVVAMDELVEQSPKTARAVLYKIYQNKGEAPEIRIAAVYQLMRTSPPASMLQRMAQATNTDYSNEVNAVVKSAIQTASELEDNVYVELATNAKATVPLLNPKPYGLQYSHQYLKDYVVREMNLAYKQHAAYISSEDSIIPQGYLYSLRANMGGVRRKYITLQALISNIEDLVRVWNKQAQKDDIPQFDSAKQHSQWASEQIARLLNMKYDEREQLEGQIYYGMGGATRFYTFNNHTLEGLPKYLKSMLSSLEQGQEFNYTKFYNPYEMTMSFPTATGLPFVYTLCTPTLFSLHGEMRVISHPEFIDEHQKFQTPETVNITADIRSVVSTKTQAELGFITPFDHHHYLAGYDKNVQFYLPLRTNIDIDVEEQQIRAEFEPLDNQSDEIFHYSTWPYTAKHDILQIKPVSHIESYELVHVREPHAWENVFGQKNGMAFRVNCTTEHKFMDFNWLYNEYWRHEGLSKFMSPWTEDSLVHSEFTLAYDNELSHADSVIVQLGWNETYFAGKRESSEPNFAQLYQKASDLSDPEDRQEYFLKKAVAGINDAEGYVYDVSVEFNGKHSNQYNATIAVGKSHVDKESRILFYYNKDASNDKDYEICFYAQNKFPNTNGLNFIYALKFDPTSTSQARLAFGESCESGSKIDLKAKLYKTQERQRYLQSHPMAHVCAQEIKEGNQQLYACRNMTARANFMDKFDFDIKYENISPYFRNLTYKLYSGVRHYGYNYLDENVWEGHGQANHINFEVDFEPDYQSANVSIETEHTQSEFNNIRISEWAKPVVAVHPVFDVYDRLNGNAQHMLFRPTCVVDDNEVNTFDNKTYPINLGKTWHVQMHYRVHGAGKHHGQQLGQEARFHDEDDYDHVVLVRDAGNNNKEAKITFNNEKNYYEIDLVPASGSSHSGSHPAGQVLINQKQIEFDDQHSYDIENGLVSVYALPNGEVKVEITDDFYVIYDGERVKLSAVDSDKFRGEVRGLCGTFDREPATDFLTPSNCVLRHPREFAATYAIIDGSAQGPAKEYQARAVKSPCYERYVMYSNVISERDYRQEQHEQVRHHQQSGAASSCSKQQTQYIEENDGQTLCFTLRPLPVCHSPCRPSKKIVKNVEVHCVQKSNVSELWKKQIEKGASPDFSLKPVTKTMKVKVAQSCVA